MPHRSACGAAASLIRLAAFAAVFLAPPPAAPDGARSAEELFREGDRRARERRYDEALDLWRQAYILKLPEYRDLKFRFPVGAKLMEREELGRYMLQSFEREIPEEKIRGIEIASARLGYFEPGLDLKQTFVDLLEVGVAGFYDPDSKGLYLIHSKPPEKRRSLFERLFDPDPHAFNAEEQRITLAHELAHALADQHFDLYSLQRSVFDDDDLMMALSALVEGEATLVMLMEMTAMRGGDPRIFLKGRSGLLGKLFQLLQNLSVDVLSSLSKSTAPLIVQEQIIFPYVKGFEFCDRLTDGDSWQKVNDAFREPPLSTEQILHPEKYLQEERDDPVELRFNAEAPLGPGWKLAYANVAGEFGIEVLFRPRLEKDDSASAAAGWDGDVYHVYVQEAGKESAGDAASDGKPPRSCLVWASTWDTEEDCREFADALQRFHELGDEGGSGASRGVWVSGKDAWFLDEVPADRLGAVLQWSLDLEREPKRLRLRKFPTTVGFPGEDGRRAGRF